MSLHNDTNDGLPIKRMLTDKLTPGTRRKAGRVGLRTRSRFLLGLVCVGVWISSAHGAAFPFPPGSTPRFRHLTTDDGLAQSEAQAIAQDSRGYMWFGTQNGVQQYDGYKFVTYQHDAQDPDSLSDNFIMALLPAPDGSLWIATQDAGVDLLRPGSGKFIHYPHDPKDPGSLVSNLVWTLAQDSQGRLWVGTDSGLDRLDPGGRVFRHYQTHNPVPNGESILTLYQDSHQRLWVGSDHGVFYYDPAHDGLMRYMPTSGPALAQAHDALYSAPIVGFHETRDGRFWIATEHGLAELSSKGEVQAFYVGKPGAADALQSSRVRGMLEDDSGDLWIATLGGGLSRFDLRTGRINTYEHDPADPASLSDDNLLALYQDRAGLMWVGTYSTGLDIYNPQTRAFGYYHHRPGHADSLASNMVWSVYKDPQQNVWVATDGGLTRMGPRRLQYRQYEMGDRPAHAQDDDATNALLADHTGTLWVGTDYGLYRYLPATDTFRHYRLMAKHGNPYEETVTTLFEDAQHRLWAGTELGLARFDPAQGKVVQRFKHDPARADSLPDNLVTMLCQSPDGALWVGTGHGIAKFDGSQDHFTNYYETDGGDHSLLGNSIAACLPEGNRGIWIGTDSGLNYLDTANGQVRHYTKAEGLTDNSISAILRDSHGDLWISTNHGLSRFSPATGDFRNYTEPDGLQKDEFNGGAAFAAADGELFFGGVNGLNAFHPENLVRNDQPPKVAITGFTVLGQPVSLDTPDGPRQDVKLRHRDNILSFDVAALDFASPAHNQFKYLLEGFDTGWHTMTGAQPITYTNLDPGRYVFRLLGSNNDGVWSQQETQLVITVLPPWWRTWWAYLSYVLLCLLAGVTGLFLFANTLRRRHVFAEEKQRRRWAEALHSLIQAVTVLEDEGAIAQQLVDSLTNFISYDRAFFYTERELNMVLIAARGIKGHEQMFYERWPSINDQLVSQLRRENTPRVLTDAEAATLESGAVSVRHYIAVPLLSGNGEFRLLLVGRALRSIQPQGLAIASAMLKQAGIALDKARLIKDLENLATTDGLTRLYNRRYFLERAENEFERSRRYQRSLSIFMLDVDHFKQINDTYGHEVGDKALRIIAATCRQTLRQLDVIGRYGGEEFVAYLPEASAAVALDVAERLRETIATLVIPVEQGEIHLTASIGVATATPATESLSMLINAADRALYEAKQQGRNRVVVSNL